MCRAPTAYICFMRMRAHPPLIGFAASCPTGYDKAETDKG